MGIVNNFFKKIKEKNPGAEMGFIDHLEELRWHLLRSFVAIIVLAIFVYLNIGFIFNHIILGPANTDFISYKVLCKLGNLINTSDLCLEKVNIKFQSTQLSGQFMLSFSVSFMLGFVLAFPYVFWEIWRFVKPALKDKELKHSRGIVFWATALFLLGVAFAYFIVAPFTINFFANYQLSEQFENIITISNYYDTMSDLILGMGIVFELPIIIYFLSKIGILTPTFMREKRRYAIVIIMLISAVITPPDWLSIFFVAIPLVLLYELSIIICARIVKEKDKKTLEIEKW